MKIAFDGQMLLKGEKTGIAWCAHHLILELAKYEENTCTVQCFSRGRTAEQLQSLDVYRKAGCDIEYCGWFSYVLYKMLWIVFPIPHRLFFRTRPDVAQFFSFIVPPGVSGRRVTVIHDMAYKSCPHTVNWKTRLWLELSMKKTCRYADHIVTVSEFSKKEIVRYLKIPEGKITVVPNAVDHRVYHAGYTRKQIQPALDKYGIEKEYFLYLGTIEPRKNLERLVLAYARLQEEVPCVPQLVLAGKEGWMYQGLYKKVRQMDLDKKILFPGYVDPKDSPLLMCGAMAFVFPSLYEGFGMPPLEAMACGTPVIVSNTAAFPEVVKDAGILVDPECEEELYQAMKSLLEQEGYRKILGLLGAERAERYTWQRSAEELMKLYRGMGNERF